eukprot:CAMPEP_0202905770 /NCGR_PEP_ID=MMETSP1392-20130828/35989_1 /ASSEMBLY_ACC=CAM_ASM_000868 /TAXON_ID=225041 /ORGANISM="Chlamydomonas chlamydogama, Strain SAG 11-48b" /LENGTH=171 /DNA_ID=CAMNT_0049594031 /DNA_START=83 /DNA_END=599 /DNA_ORIENTATION=-
MEVARVRSHPKVIQSLLVPAACCARWVQTPSLSSHGWLQVVAPGVPHQVGPAAAGRAQLNRGVIIGQPELDIICGRPQPISTGLKHRVQVVVSHSVYLHRTRLIHHTLQLVHGPLLGALLMLPGRYEVAWPVIIAAQAAVDASTAAQGAIYDADTCWAVAYLGLRFLEKAA